MRSVFLSLVSVTALLVAARPSQAPTRLEFDSPQAYVMLMQADNEQFWPLLEVRESAALGVDHAQVVVWYDDQTLIDGKLVKLYLRVVAACPLVMSGMVCGCDPVVRDGFSLSKVRSIDVDFFTKVGEVKGLKPSKENIK